MYAIPETAARPEFDPRHVTNVRVAVLSDDGVTARVRIEDCGIHLRQGEIYDVPTTALEHR